MNTVNCVSKIKNELAREFHEQNLADFKKKYKEIQSRAVFANDDKKLEAEAEAQTLKRKYNERLFEYIATNN